MKRKRRALDDSQPCDLLLTDTSGRSIKVHKGLLMDESDYFANLLKHNNLDEVHLDEKYLLEMMQYLYRYRWDGELNPAGGNGSGTGIGYTPDDLAKYQNLMHGDLEILMNLLVISDKYSFKQLYRYLVGELNCQISPSSVIQIYNFSIKLGLDQFRDQTKFMILTWLPQLTHTELFLQLPEQSIMDIFTCEPPDIDNECKLNALSAWWSKNKDSDMTNLWMKLITCAHS